MNEKELLAALRVTGRYEVVTQENGTYIVIPMAPEAIMLTREAVSQCSEHFRKKTE